MRIAASVLLMGIAACSKPQPKLSDAEVEKIGAEFPGISKECLQTLRMEGSDTKADLSTERCFALEPARTWKGLWRDEFEGSQFCAAPAKTCAHREGGLFVHLNWPKVPGTGGLYAVEFVGRMSKDSAWWGGRATNYREMIVDKVISIKELEPPFPNATEAQRKAWEDKCRKDPQCLTGDEMYALGKK